MSINEIEDWLEKLRLNLVIRTGRSDIQVSGGPYRAYDVSVSHGEDCQPIVDFYSAIRWDQRRVQNALTYAADMLRNWEATLSAHEKDMKACKGHFEQLKQMFPDLDLAYTTRYADHHFVRAEKTEDKRKVWFDLWPGMTALDIHRLASYIKDLNRKLDEKGLFWIGTDYVREE